MRPLLLLLLTIAAVSPRADACDAYLAGGGRHLEVLLAKARRDARDSDVQAARDALAEGSAAAAERLGTLGRDFDLLALHPGVAARLTRFLEFVHASPAILERGPADAFEAFRTELGQVDLNRALLLDAIERERILWHGLIPNFVRTATGDEAEMYRWLARTGLGRAVDLHMSHEGAKTSPFASFSQQSELARLVVHVPPDQERRRYVWRITVDVLDVVYVHISGGLIEEALVFAYLNPERFDRLHETAGERYHVSIADMLEDRHFMRFGGQLPILERDLPHVERPSRVKSDGH